MTYDVLFRQPSIRPTPMDVASLIAEGVDENAVLEAGLNIYPQTQTPQMEQFSANLDVTLPYIQAISDRLALDHAEDEVLFAGRDAEALYDDFAITHPQVRSGLLPASIPFWSSQGMKYDVLARSFLSKYGLTEEFMGSDDARCVVVDTGFAGSIGDYVREQACRLYGIDLELTGKLAVKLVSERWGDRAIIDLDGEDITLRNERERSNNYELAVGLQLMPRYHGPYRFLKLHRSGAIALPGPSKLTPDIDVAECRSNASIVNPVAAALVQLRIVRSAMERTPSAPGSAA